MTRIIGVISGKGGVGKTTVVANLGAILASDFKKDVVIVDCNITTSHLALYLGMYYCPVTLNQVLKGEAKIEDAMYEYHISGLRVIPSSLSLGDLKGSDIAKLKHSLKSLFGKTDIILLDSAPGLGREAMATLQAADEVIFVNTPFVPSTMDIMKCHQIVNEMGLKPLGVVLNMVGKEKYELGREEVEQIAEIPVISLIPMDKNVLKSLALKVPVYLFSPNSPASIEMKKLAAKLIGKEYRPPNLFSAFLRLFGIRPKE
jgi:septum site-determining protein MinD